MQPIADWLLNALSTFPARQIRDGYLRNIKARIESFYARFGRKVVVMSHSFGSNVFFYFLKYVRHGGRCSILYMAGPSNWASFVFSFCNQNLFYPYRASKGIEGTQSQVYSH